MFAPWRKSSKYCSSECVPGKPRTYADRDCVNCGNSFHPKKNKTQRFCTRSCYIEHHDKNRQKRVDNGGYIIIYRPEYSDRQSGQMMEHRAVMSEFLGRKLETHETVHHKDGNKQNNDISNLQLRSGKHGKGAVFKCADCGSHNIIADSI
jgi:DNA-directed RNA polymerase subunit M/transcription elongation factor TFIIS